MFQCTSREYPHSVMVLFISYLGLFVLCSVHPVVKSAQTSVEDAPIDYKAMGLFEAFRTKDTPVHYDLHPSSVVVDIGHLIVILLCFIFLTTLVFIILGSKGTEKLTTAVKVIILSHPGVILLVTIFGNSWQNGSITSPSSFMTSMHQHNLTINMQINVGLKSLNITLTGGVESSYGVSTGEYNERFQFDGANEMSDCFNSGMQHGLPQPLLYVAEYLSIDAGGFRWSRAIREAGHFTYVILWSCFALWIVSNTILCFNVYRGAAFISTLGVAMTFACVLYHFIQPSVALEIHFSSGYLDLHYGWCYWLCFVSGILTLITGVVLLLLNHLTKTQLQKIFLIDQSAMEDTYTYQTLKPMEKNTMDTNRDLHQVYNNPVFNVEDESMKEPSSSKDVSSRRRISSSTSNGRIHTSVIQVTPSEEPTRKLSRASSCVSDAASAQMTFDDSVIAFPIGDFSINDIWGSTLSDSEVG